MKYGNITLGQIEATINKLGGEQGMIRLLRGELVVSGPKLPEVPIWKTVTIGTKSAEEYCAALTRAGMVVNENEKERQYPLLRNMNLSKEVVDVDLVLLSVRDMTYGYGAGSSGGGELEVEFGMVRTMGMALGFEPCSIEVALALRLAYTDQPSQEGEMLVGGAPGEDPVTFFVGFYEDWEQPCLGAEQSLGERWGESDRFVFVRPRL